MKTGLVLGKFAPFHRGHQLLVETSLAETDRTVVLIYDCPELSVPPLDVRANWIRKLYPQASVVEAWDGPIETGLTPAITEKHDAYLKHRLSGYGITHFFCSERYGEHVSRGLGAIDRRVDEARIGVPISATQIRENVFDHRHFLDPVVHRDLITKVVFLGAPSTGKTTLAQAIAKRLNTTWMPEYGREYWESHQDARRLSLHQLLEIAVGHREREEVLLRDANRVFFVDTDATTTRLFSRYYHDTSLPELDYLAEECRLRYDLFFLCEPDIPYDDTWDRSGEVMRQQMQRRVESDLIARKVPFTRLSGSLANRVAKVISTLHY